MKTMDELTEKLIQKLDDDCLQMTNTCIDKIKQNPMWAFDNTDTLDICNKLHDLADDIEQYKEEYYDNNTLTDKKVKTLLSCDNLVDIVQNHYYNIDVDKAPNIKTTEGIMEILNNVAVSREKSERIEPEL